jgi:hypothetical protein
MSFTDSLLQTASTVGGVVAGIGAATNLASALSTGTNIPGALSSALRSVNLPPAGQAVAGLLGAASATFGGDASPNDWRVRLSIANAASFQGSPILAPLKKAGGLIFPYTPQINIASSAKYTPISTIHTNYTMQAFQNSDPGSISITAPMNVEDATQGLYWIGAVHYLRSLTKMFTGEDALAGNPPPIVFLNGYGSYVFKNVPVIVTTFSVQLDNDCDYIGVDTSGGGGGPLGGLGGAASQLNDIAGIAGASVPGLSGVANSLSNAAGALGSIASIANTVSSLAGGGSAGDVTHVPTKSSFSVTLQPVYSRNSVKNFSLDKFVQGGYLNNSFGYI